MNQSPASCPLVPRMDTGHLGPHGLNALYLAAEEHNREKGCVLVHMEMVFLVKGNSI